MGKIFLLVLNFSMDLGYSRPGVFVILRVFPVVRELTLRISKLLFSGAQMAGIINSDTSVSSDKMLKPYVKSDDLSRGLKSLGRHFTREDHVPFTCFSFDRNGIDLTHEGTGDSYSHRANLRKTEFVSLQFSTALWVCESAVARCGFEFGIAGSLIAFFDAAKEIIKGGLHSGQSILQYLRMHTLQIRAQLLDLRQLVLLVLIANRCVRVLISAISLSQPRIVKLTADIEGVGKLLLDCFRDFYSELVSFTHSIMLPFTNRSYNEITCIYAGFQLCNQEWHSSPTKINHFGRGLLPKKVKRRNGRTTRI